MKQKSTPNVGDCQAKLKAKIKKLRAEVRRLDVLSQYWLTRFDEIQAQYQNTLEYKLQEALDARHGS